MAQLFVPLLPIRPIAFSLNSNESVVLPLEKSTLAPPLSATLKWTSWCFWTVIAIF